MTLDAVRARNTSASSSRLGDVAVTAQNPKLRSLASQQPAVDVMERPTNAQSQSTTPRQIAGTSLASVGNILQDLIGAAGKFVGAIAESAKGLVSGVAGGINGLIDAGAGFIGVIGNALSQLVGLLG